jgi:hypothetical protein
MIKLIKQLLFGNPIRGVPISGNCKIAYSICPRDYLQAYPVNDLQEVTKECEFVIIID